MPYRRLIRVAMQEEPADLILANARIINVFNGEIEKGNVAIKDGRIAGIGNYQNAKEIRNLKGKYLAPGLIDGHTHLESSMLDVPQYARAVVARGTTAIVTDLHEIANVCGLAGIRYVINAARHLPLAVFLMAPSSVPATHMETSGAALDVDDLRKVQRWEECIGLGEVMNFPGVLNASPDLIEKVALYQDRAVDGHAPGLSGPSLNAYIGAGIRSDHESVTFEEAKEKLQRGMFVMIREGSSEKNLEALLPLVTDKTYKRCMFVVDDRSAFDLLKDGDIDAVVRKAISLGLNPVRAIQLATINAAEYFHLVGHGAIGPGYWANLIVLDDIKSFTIESVYAHGELVAQGGKALFNPRKFSGRNMDKTVNFKSFTSDALRLYTQREKSLVIEVIPGQIITLKRLEKMKTAADGLVIPDTERDILKLAVVERHRATGNIGLGMVKGFGLKSGALASSVAHDSHNIVAVGTNDEDISAAVKEIERLHGGIVAVADGKVLGRLALPVAGLLSDEPLETVVNKLGLLEETAAKLGSRLPSPFSTLSFLALPVIPELRLTDRGIIDVNEFRMVEF